MEGVEVRYGDEPRGNIESDQQLIKHLILKEMCEILAPAGYAGLPLVVSHGEATIARTAALEVATYQPSGADEARARQLHPNL